MTHERLQEQMDGALDPVIAREMDRHLADCASCRGLAADLAAIVDAAAAVKPIEPPAHVWLQVAGRWRHDNTDLIARYQAAGTAPRARRPRWHLLVAAAVFAVAAGGGWIAWRATSAVDGGTGVLLPRASAAERAGNASAEPLVETAQRDIQAAEQLYMRAIEGLEKAAASQKDLLEPQVAAMLDRNLEVIDEAIGESRAAMQSQPNSAVARESLFEALRRKAALLQNTISLVSEIGRGNQAGASRLAGG
ncbi:MAG: zf-HC2 domain-containing protein [Vicinamibacterales bacterium]